MIQALNIQATTNNALYNKGVAYCVSTFESLNTEKKIIEKKIANNLVVPNICILSLSLSLSSRADVNYTFFSSRVRAREACRIPCKQRTSRSSLCSFLCPFTNRTRGKISRIIHSKYSDYETKTIREMGLCEAQVQSCRTGDRKIYLRKPESNTQRSRF